MDASQLSSVVREGLASVPEPWDLDTGRPLSRETDSKVNVRPLSIGLTTNTFLVEMKPKDRYLHTRDRTDEGVAP